ncbi:metabotropic glutamate receptor-like [Tubulanus polymorphus]|uniref:metabotropic glutamate receptor-like n=1 Tax=Tubulanus polymorphus TaxID=672921 RepID=UPI003DA5C5E8
MMNTSTNISGRNGLPGLRDKQWVIPLMVLAGLGMLIVLFFEIYILSKMIGTRLVKTFRTLWLGQVLLLGVFLCYLVCFLFVVEQTKATCGMQRFGVGVSYALCFSVLMVKLMIVFSSHNIGYLRGVYQVLMLTFAWGVQIVIDSEWLILSPPGLKMNNGENVCNHEFLDHIKSFVYVMFLIFVCTILAVRAHGIITNHREGIFIGLAAGFSIPIWIAWTLVGSLNESIEFKDPCMAFGLLINATLILFCMFLPKVRQLNTLGVEAIYMEDDNEREVYGSVIYGAPDKASGVYWNGGVMSHYPDSVLRSDPVILKSQSEYMPHIISGNIDVDALHLKHPGSVKSAPLYAGGTLRRYGPPESAYGTIGNGRVLRVTGDLTGKGPLDTKKAQSEIGYADVKPRSQRGTLRRSGSLTDLGAL